MNTAQAIVLSRQIGRDALQARYEADIDQPWWMEADLSTLSDHDYEADERAEPLDIDKHREEWVS